MIKFSTAILIVIASLVAGPVFAACTYPPAVSVPDGSQASETEMMRAKQSVTAYIAQVEAYLKCIDTVPHANPCARWQTAITPRCWLLKPLTSSRPTRALSNNSPR
jgi:hypothetical protein